MLTDIAEAKYQTESDEVQLRGIHLASRKADMPTMIWFADLVEPVENFKAFFNRPDNKILDQRNVWLLNYRNMGHSDHHESFDLDVSQLIINVSQDIAADVMRFMDQQKLTMATLGGHGFGAKVALATAISNLNRCTGVIALEGGPLNHVHYEAYQELASYVKFCASLPIDRLDHGKATKMINENVTCEKWASIFRQNLEPKSDGCSWKFNVQDLAADMSKR